MNKLILTAAVAVLSTLSVASPSILDELVSTPNVETTPDPVKCANFSGQWDGVCVTTEGKQFPEKLAIVQKGCGYLNIRRSAGPIPLPTPVPTPIPTVDEEDTNHHRGVHLLVGGMMSSSGSLPGCKPNEKECNSGVTFTHGMESHWNKDLTAITVFASGYGKKIGLNEAPRGFHAKKEIKLVDNRLFIESSAMGGKPGAHVKLCTLNKVN